MGKIIVAAIDADGCYLAKSANSGTQYRPTTEQVAQARQHNALIIQDLKSRVSDARARKLILLSGSKRQDLGTDYDNAVKEGRGPGSFFPYLEDLADYFQSQRLRVELNRFLMADLYQNLEPGNTWQRYHTLPFDIMAEIDAIAEQKNDPKLRLTPAERESLTKRWRELRAQIKYDEIFAKKTPHLENKTPIVRAQTHIIATELKDVNVEFSEDEIEYRFYDDGDRDNRIFNELITINPLQIPSNVTIVILKLDPIYDPDKGIQEIARIKGTGAVDRQIYDTIQREFPNNRRNNESSAPAGSNRNILLPGQNDARSNAQNERQRLLPSGSGQSSLEESSESSKCCCSIS